MIPLSIGISVDPTGKDHQTFVANCHVMKGAGKNNPGFPVFDKLRAVRSLLDFYKTLGRELVFRALKRHKGEWRYWSGTHWELYPDYAFAADISRLLGGDIDDKQMTSVLNTTADQESINYHVFDKKEVIAFANCSLSREGRTLTKTLHNQTDYSTFRIPYPIDMKALCPEWVRLVERTLPNIEDRNTLQELFGYCLFPSYQGQVMFILSGEPSTGKGTLMEVLSRLLGAERVTGVRMETLGETHGLAPLKGAYVNFDPETQYLPREGENILKFITGGGSVTINEKYEKQITTPLTVRMVMSCNTIPKFNDRTDALWQRIVVIPFDHKVPEAERVELSVLLAKLQPEMTGIVGWALKGLLRVLKNGRTRSIAFTQSERAKEILGHHRTASDHFLEWFEVFVATAEDPQAETKQTDVYQHFCQWLRQCNYGACGKGHFMTAMERKGHKDIKAGGRKEQRQSVFRGIALRAIQEE